MRIALITARSPLPVRVEPCGESLRTASLARALARHGHRVTIYARAEDPRCPGTAILGKGVSVEHVAAGPDRPLAAEQAARHMPEFARYLTERWQARPPDIAHAFTWTCGLAAIGAVRGSDIPVVQSFESLASAERRQPGNLDVSGCRLELEEAIGHRAAAVLAGSEDEARELARMSVPKAAIRVIPSGIDTDVYGPNGKRDTPRGRSRLIAFAPAGRISGLESLIRALASLPDAELVIVGGPDARHLPRSGPFRELQQLARTLHVRNRVTFAGQVAQADLPDLLRSAHVMVSASPYEPAGTATLQAMACGVPAVVSAVGGQADAVIDGVTGLLVPAENPAALVQRLRTLLARPAILQAYGIAAADRARSRYSWDRIARETTATYERCMRPTPAVAERSLDDDMAELERTVDLRDDVALA